MDLLKIVIETHENYKQTSLFPWVPKSEKNIKVQLDAIPIRYMNKKYIVALAFPYNYNYIHLENNIDIFKISLIHCSDELNLALYSCEKYDDYFYTLNDLRYKIPNDKYTDFKFYNNEEININHIDYYFKNMLFDNLPPMAYLKVQSSMPNTGSVLYNVSTKTIYGIVYCSLDDHIIIPSIAIKRLFDGIEYGFQYSTLYADYELINKSYESCIKIVNSQYNNLKVNDRIIDINNMMIINGKIKYSKINEWVPIEVYLWYEWLPNNNLVLTKYGKNKRDIILPFINFKDILNIPIIERNTNRNKKISYELLEYFYEHNLIISTPEINEYILNPYKKNNLIIEINDILIIQKYIEPTEINDVNIITN